MNIYVVETALTDEWTQRAITMAATPEEILDSPISKVMISQGRAVVITPMETYAPQSGTAFSQLVTCAGYLENKEELVDALYSKPEYETQWEDDVVEAIAEIKRIGWGYELKLMDKLTKILLANGYITRTN